jgi:hypothetical protein
VILLDLDTLQNNDSLLYGELLSLCVNALARRTAHVANKEPSLLGKTLKQRVLKPKATKIQQNNTILCFMRCPPNLPL